MNNHLSEIVNRKINSFRNNKILLNLPITNNLPNQKFITYYSSTERKNNLRINNNQYNKPYIISNENPVESKKYFNYKKKKIYETINEDPLIKNIKLHFKTLEGKIDKIREVVSNSNSKNKNNNINYNVYNIQKSRNVFPINQIKYETISQYNNFPITDNFNQININIKTPNFKNENYKTNKRNNNRSLNNLDFYKIKNNNLNNQEVKNSFLKEVNVAKISFTPQLNESSINDCDIGKLSIQINGNKTLKKDSIDNELNLSQLANDIIRTFDLDSNSKEKNSEKKFNNNFKFNSKVNNFMNKCNVEKLKNERMINNIISDNNYFCFTPKKKIEKDKILIFKDFQNKKIEKSSERENKKEKNKMLENEEKNEINEEKLEDEILNEIMKSVEENKNKQNKKSKNISFDLNSNVQIIYNENEEITKIQIFQKDKLIKPKNKNLKKTNKQNKSIILPFKKEEILIDNNYISAELKDEIELCGLVEKNEEEIKERI